MVQPSPWPFYTAIAIAQLAFVLLCYFHYYQLSIYFVAWSFLYFSLVIGMWFRDIIVESTYQGMHTLVVQQGLRFGFMLVLLSEAMFFFSFFWCFFYMAISPSIWIGCVWPPLGIKPINPLGIPLLNTLVLLTSGIFATATHRNLFRDDEGAYEDIRAGLLVSIYFGCAFTALQLWEYTNAQFSINDGIYGSIFYVATGFHGLHVIVGTIALIVQELRHEAPRFHHQIDHHVGLELSIWYWHFVDVIWILLYLTIYCWGYRYGTF